MPTRMVAKGQEANKVTARNTAIHLTTNQKEATVQKWADWILKKREAARSGEVAVIRERDSN